MREGASWSGLMASSRKFRGDRLRNHPSYEMQCYGCCARLNTVAIIKTEMHYLLTGTTFMASDVVCNSVPVLQYVSSADRMQNTQVPSWIRPPPLRSHICHPRTHRRFSTLTYDSIESPPSSNAGVFSVGGAAGCEERLRPARGPEICSLQGGTGSQGEPRCSGDPVKNPVTI